MHDLLEDCADDLQLRFVDNQYGPAVPLESEVGRPLPRSLHSCERLPHLGLQARNIFLRSRLLLHLRGLQDPSHRASLRRRGLDIVAPRAFDRGTVRKRDLRAEGRRQPAAVLCGGARGEDVGVRLLIVELLRLRPPLRLEPHLFLVDGVRIGEGDGETRLHRDHCAAAMIVGGELALVHTRTLVHNLLALGCVDDAGSAKPAALRLHEALLLVASTRVDLRTQRQAKRLHLDELT
mmetsp:Transcript_75715/g.219907  ORF Transcript_75715/g.219907 Transcript_75715/m.219907 type:complete len:236 (-) Transcript_75715:1162-1869(-)